MAGSAYRAPAGRKPLSAALAAMVAAVIAVEGGYVNHLADPGGETNMGITKAVAAEAGYNGPMRQLPREVAESIYFQRYLVAPGYAPLAELDVPVTQELFDTTVNMGAPRPSRWLQATINDACGTSLAVDGKVGAGTIAAYRTCQVRLGAAELCETTLALLDARQRAEYGRLTIGNRRLRTFYRGWIAHRVGNVDPRRCRAAA